MRVRIPTPVNRVLDRVEHHRRVAVGSTAAVILTAAVGLVWASPYAAVIAAGCLAVYVTGVWFAVREMRIREALRQAAYDLAAERQENALLRAGDPTAPTAQLRHIGDHGELT